MAVIDKKQLARREKLYLEAITMNGLTPFAVY